MLDHVDSLILDGSRRLRGVTPDAATILEAMPGWQAWEERLREAATGEGSSLEAVLREREAYGLAVLRQRTQSGVGRP